MALLETAGGGVSAGLSRKRIGGLVGAQTRTQDLCALFPEVSTSCDSFAMWFPLLWLLGFAFLLIYILIQIWPVTVGALLIWAIVAYLKRAHPSRSVAPKAMPKPTLVKATAKPKPTLVKSTPARELPTPD